MGIGGVVIMQIFEFNGITFANYQKFVFGSIEGLNEGDVTQQTEQYLEQDGVDILSSYYEPRTVTLKGHILAENEVELYDLRQKLTRACNSKTKGTLRYGNGLKTYFSEAVAELPQYGGAIANKGLPFSIDFTLYNFFWKDDYKRIDNVLKLVNHIDDSFTFPLQFTTLTTIATVTNSGDVPCPLIIKILGIGGTVGAEGFTMINNTTGQFITLTYNIIDDEVVTIDTQELTIVSSLNGNILHKITNDSDIDMKLVLGPNLIEGINSAGNQIIITTEHYDMYVGV